MLTGFHFHAVESCGESSFALEATDTVVLNELPRCSDHGHRTVHNGESEYVDRNN